VRFLQEAIEMKTLIESNSTQPATDSVTELIVALDYPRSDQAYHCVEKLRGLPVIFKVGLELFLNGGNDFVKDLVHQKNRVFLDLKFHDIPQTVARAAKQAALLHVEMFTLHLAGGSSMLRAVVDELSQIPTLKPKILGVSVLTSFDDVRWAEVTKSLTGHASLVSDSVIGLVDHAQKWGRMVWSVRRSNCRRFEKQTPPFIRWCPGFAPNDSNWVRSVVKKARVLLGPMTKHELLPPAQARTLGANAIVVGRPITAAIDPREAAVAILKDLG
jgi:orotidine-5'-phosphate decarboxylase